MGITYSQSQTPSRGHPVHHQETSRRPQNLQGPPASQSSRCASVEPGRVQTHTGLGTQSIGLYRPKRQQAHSPLCAPESWVSAGSHFPPTQGHGSRALPYQPAATRYHLHHSKGPLTQDGLRAHSVESETNTGCLQTGKVIHSLCALVSAFSRRKVAPPRAQCQEYPGILQTQHRSTVNSV